MRYFIGLLITCWIGFAAAEEKPVGTVSYTEGVVEIFDAGQAGRRSAKVNDKVYESTVLITMVGAKAEITWDELKTVSTVASSQNVRIAQLYQKYMEESLSPTERLLRGLKMLLAKDADEMASTASVSAVRNARTDLEESLYWKSRQANLAKGRELFDSKQYEAAAKELQNVVDNDPFSDEAAQALIMLVLTHKQLNQKVQAIATLDRYTRDFPNHSLLVMTQNVLKDMKE